MPQFIGKLIGGLLGYSVAGPFGAVIGLLAGHFFDKGISGQFRMASPEHLHKVQTVFFTTVYTVMGRLAKADGRISEAEIKQAEHLMGQMGLTSEHRREAIELFKKGAQADFDIESVLIDYKRDCSKHPKLNHMLLVYMISIALADGSIHPLEEQILKQVAHSLNINPHAFERLINQTRAQQHFSGQAAGATRADALKDAYQALGVPDDVNDRTLKKAYRRQMSQYHPDKLIAEGMPEDMVKMATVKSQEVQAAYELIKKQRKGNG